ncbi:UDP-N-acetylglucosamine 2-epimerase (non-hydrolyzing) [Polaribacter sp.]|nr:UDP-N-acetylglucosamine 2-epimerase (non-hydrolyzing) [Polaribacter sp.]
MNLIKIITVIGARPQIIKAAAISRTISKKFSLSIEELIVHTGQHYDNNMSEVFFEELSIPKPDYNLNIGSGSHGFQTARMVEGLESLLLKEKPNYLLLYGDTNSTLAGAVAASKLNIPIIHVEAGLRSFNRKMPEEINRIVCDHLSTFLFSPTKAGFDNLIKEGFESNIDTQYTAENPGVFHCGDIMFDNSMYFSSLADSQSNILTEYDLTNNQFVLATVHRANNTDNRNNLHSIFKSLLEISLEQTVVLPLHPRTKKELELDVNIDLYEKLVNSENILLLAPVSFLDMIALEKNSSIIITDSGGVQKEAYFFGKPCIILRSETEWVEILETGMAVLAAADYQSIIESYHRFINLDKLVFPKLFGDGLASDFICSTLLENNNSSL